MNTETPARQAPGAPDRLAYFESLYGGSDDPYGLRTRWYEERKRALLLAALPHRRYHSVYEPGCGAGELTVALAARCDRVLASDFSPQARASAQARTAALPNVRIAAHALPQDFPHADGPFDLVVVSELGYFLGEDAMQALARDCADALGEDGVLVACNWRPDFEARVLATDAVHRAFGATGLTRTVAHTESDFVLDIWCRDPRSVAQREGIR
ncbi:MULTISPECIES: class I SAM-dependent methyltransferase [unclassified Variovorax]|uniref:class I SAM-dependent methyltransferase n=1 Tax=unclassified Variovorax TaxID=663243 RepID=UPI002575306F|nr:MULTISPECIES: class I SAM-dependent methyltransferase [unclassified Variovorax]MDM0090451.1 class I SAM-dependent methyltransferase [Variovorax sp. J22G40]MDM0147884.1 class I SAM-dependent methyltransferase [Variovorax sp. J2P1-31]